MEIDKDKQAEALAKAKAILSNAEKNREAVRVEKGVRALLQGEFDVLYNDELVENLASYILNKYILDEKQEALEVLEKVGESLCGQDVDIRERSLMILSVFSEIIIAEEFTEFQEILSGILVQWLRIENELIAGFEFVCSQLQKIILKLLINEHWQKLEDQITILNQITSGEIVKNNLIRGMSVKIHENLAEPDILDNLVSVYLDENDDRREVAQTILIQLGRFAAMFLVQKMIYSNNKEDRFALIDIIPQVGEVSVPVLIGCLKDEPQWFVIRNIILIISRLDDPELYSVVEPFLNHKDIRVQQQAINCIEMLGGPQVRKRLIAALTQVNDDLKGQIINQLGQTADMDVGDAFLSLLENRGNIARHVQADLILKLCIWIKCFPFSRAISCLEDLINERKKRYGRGDRIVIEASTSLQVLKEKLKEETLDIFENGTDFLTDEMSSENEIVAQITEDQEETLFSLDEIDNISAGGDIAESGTEPVSDQTGDKEQTTGEEEPYSTAQDQHLIIWSRLYEEMSSDEANKFFALLKPVTCKAGEEVVSQGDTISDIFLIDSGFGGLSHGDEDGDTLLSSLQTGDLIGSEGFFRNLKWTVSLSAQTDLQVRVLELDGFKKLAKKFPKLSGKLLDYCDHFDVVPYLIYQVEDDEVEPLRGEITVDGTSLFQDSSGVAVEDAAMGSLHYITSGGYCFTLPFVHQDNAEAIIGRQVSSGVTLDDGSEKKCFGVVCGARSYDGDDQVIFVYVKFYHPLINADYTCESINIM